MVLKEIKRKEEEGLKKKGNQKGDKMHKINLIHFSMTIIEKEPAKKAKEKMKKRKKLN